MERHNGIEPDPEGAFVYYADAQATVEALQDEKLMLERGVSAQSALIDGLQSQLIQRTAALEALQRERDEAKASSDMWKREAYLIGDALRPLCGLSEYEFGWKLAVKIIADKLAALDDERDRLACRLGQVP